MYLEDLAFVISRGGWSVTKTYSHFTFNQEAFKKKIFFNESKIQTKRKKFY